MTTLEESSDRLKRMFADLEKNVGEHDREVPKLSEREMRMAGMIARAMFGVKATKQR